MSLSILLGETEPWLLGAGACVVILLIVSILILRRGGQRNQAKSEEEIVLAPTPVEPQCEVEEEDDTSADSCESETEPLTTYCNNGCQGACACPSLEPEEIQRGHSEPALSPQSFLSPPDVPPPEPIPEVSKPDSQSSLRKRSMDKGRLTFQHFKDKLHGSHESFDAGVTSDRTGRELDRSGRRGSELNGSGPRGTAFNGSGRRRSESAKDERRTSLFSGWRRRSLPAGSKRRSSEQVSDTSSQHKTDSLKLLRGIFSFKKSTSIEEVNSPPVDPPVA